MTDLASRLSQVQQLISSAAERFHRPMPQLIVVTKNHSVELPLQLHKLGIRDFGENRVQEAVTKIDEFRERVTVDETRWHVIGQLQTNKVKQAVEFASSIHSLDRLSLLLELAKRTESLKMPLEVFIQVNLTDNLDRGGVQPEALNAFADQVVAISTLRLAGIMAVASVGVEPQFEFERVAKLSEELQVQHLAANKLSIGMSLDFVEAIEFGATHLRIGSAITGNRPI